jgi:hypothetical protein
MVDYDFAMSLSRVKLIVDYESQRITKERAALGKADSMLSQIQCSRPSIPLEFYTHLTLPTI